MVLVPLYVNEVHALDQGALQALGGAHEVFPVSPYVLDKQNVEWHLPGSSECLLMNLRTLSMDALPLPSL